jgi:hypothetical protein
MANSIVKASHVFAMRKRLAGIPGPDILHFVQYINLKVFLKRVVSTS